MFEKLKKSSVGTQKLFAVTVSGLITFMILGIWVLTKPIDQNAVYARAQRGEDLPLIVVVQNYVKKIPQGTFDNLKNLGTALNSGLFESQIEYSSE